MMDIFPWFNPSAYLERRDMAVIINEATAIS